MEDLINYINSGNCFALVGAGPSCEIGLPSWKQLADGIYSDMKSENLDITNFMEEYHAKADYPKFFNEIWHKHGQDWLLKKINYKITDTKIQGRVYNFISSFPFRSYFTTNLR
ncbi:MAG: Sir2 family NAD-dependent protein deacetylase [Ignavibacteria bacterium]|nr:Sir2 family NAD-dependent protein deacetylase [Ignavibacteria bacterium]MDP3830100.1 Sir2 family NAD-dependent protein deacetylase [Ignavibacteriaceae bacterium]